jgi:integrase
MRVRIKGINQIKKTLATGESVTYYYAWKGGPRIRDPRTPEGQADWLRENAKRAKPKHKTLLSLTRYFQGTTEFKKLSPRTQKDYLGHIAAIEAEFGDMPISGLTDRRARGVFKDWKDRLAQRSERQADYHWTTLARIFSVCKDRGKIDVNPCEKGGRIYHGTRAEIIWTDEEEVRFLAVAPPQVRLPFQIGLWTGQREGDILRLPWSAYDGDFIRLKTSKTGSYLAVPISKELQHVLDRTARVSPIICTNSLGQVWTGDGFRSSFSKARKKAGVEGKQFSDLRGTAVTRLASIGVSVPAIRSFTGHSLGQINSILDKHYLAHDQNLAIEARDRLERRTKTPNRVPNKGNVSSLTKEKSS